MVSSPSSPKQKKQKPADTDSVSPEELAALARSRKSIESKRKGRGALVLSKTQTKSTGLRIPQA